MEAFIRNEEYNLIRQQAYNLVNGHTAANDRSVVEALKSLAMEKVLSVFNYVNKEQQVLIEMIRDVKNREEAELFLLKLHPYVIPFPEVTQQTVKKLFPKAKKLKLPKVDNINLMEITYLGWEDSGTNKRYIITKHGDRLIGIDGTFQPIHQKGICTLCNRLEEVGMFLHEKKGEVLGTFVKRGNYICKDSVSCNQNIISVQKLHDFIDLLKK
ncbi:FusB/FusC family EF-G-binding protein [Priestia taiwanensis]|uniref:Elongation factor G-binding protein n=1 Tax=Priestia taiwanensis TaxID=1347902 RepID=A0A917API4_9BACI|nr:FusB/FusC family EF-G-binding protein [Priestia taiwanensis]GGE63864.1 elongation factor G-binding protein [Priestia taiwanensis]